MYIKLAKERAAFKQRFDTTTATRKSYYLVVMAKQLNNFRVRLSQLAILLICINCIVCGDSWQKPGCHKVGMYKCNMHLFLAIYCKLMCKNRSQAQNRHSRLRRIQHWNERLSWLLWVLCRSVNTAGPAGRLQSSAEAGHVDRPVLQHHGIGGRIRVRQLFGWSEEHHLQVSHQVLVLSLQKGLSGSDGKSCFIWIRIANASIQFGEIFLNKSIIPWPLMLLFIVLSDHKYIRIYPIHSFDPLIY